MCDRGKAQHSELNGKSQRGSTKIRSRKKQQKERYYLVGSWAITSRRLKTNHIFKVLLHQFKIQVTKIQTSQKLDNWQPQTQHRRQQMQSGQKQSTTSTLKYLFRRTTTMSSGHLIVIDISPWTAKLVSGRNSSNEITKIKVPFTAHITCAFRFEEDW